MSLDPGGSLDPDGFGPPPIRSLSTAIALAGELFELDRRTKLAVLVDQSPVGPGLALSFDSGTPDALAQVDEIVLRACADAPACRVVLAVKRPRRRKQDPAVDECDLATFRELRVRHRAAGVTLLDLLVFHGDRVSSLAELTGELTYRDCSEPREAGSA